jgi:hypothetical protein
MTEVNPMVRTIGTGLLGESATVPFSRIITQLLAAAAAQPVDMWATRQRCPSFSAGRRLTDFTADGSLPDGHGRAVL